MRPDTTKEAQRWLKQSERDLDDARFAYDGRRYNLVCFLAQQAAEKSLKAYLYYKGKEDVWGHSVAELCQDSLGIDADFAGVEKDASSLDKYYIPTRYPNGLPGGIPADVYQMDDATRALASVDKIIKLVKSKLGG